MYLLSEMKVAGLEVGTTLKTILTLNGMSTTIADKFKELADSIFTSYSTLEYNSLFLSDVPETNATYLSKYLEIHSQKIIKFGKMFDSSLFPDGGKIKTQTFTDTIQYKNQTEEIYDRDVTNETSPIGNSPSSEISTPSGKGKLNDTTQKISEDLNNTETITNTETEHEPLVDFERIMKNGISAYSLVDSFIQQIIEEFNSV